MTYRFMTAHEGEYGIRVMCQALEVSRSGYYAWRVRGQTTHQEQPTANLLSHIQKIFADSQQTYLWQSACLC